MHGTHRFKITLGVFTSDYVNIFLLMVQQPKWGLDRPIFEVSRSHKHTHTRARASSKLVICSSQRPVPTH